MWTGLDEVDRLIRFEWRYIKNPYKDRPFIYVALDGDKIVGFRAFVCQLFIIDGKEYKVLSPADAIINPEYRRRGIFSKLNNLFLQDISSDGYEDFIILNLSSNKFSTPASLKLGWQKADGLKNYMYRFSAINFFKTYLTNNKQITSSNSKKLNIEISDILHIDELAEFNASHRESEILVNIHDYEYYKWRYESSNENYIYAYRRSEKNLVSYIILKRNSKFYYSLIEFGLTGKKEFKNLIKIVTKKLSIPILSVFSVSMHDSKFFYFCGMISEPNFMKRFRKKQSLPVLVRPPKTKVKEQDFFINGKDIRKMNNWKLFKADVH